MFISNLSMVSRLIEMSPPTRSACCRGCQHLVSLVFLDNRGGRTWITGRVVIGKMVRIPPGSRQRSSTTAARIDQLEPIITALALLRSTWGAFLQAGKTRLEDCGHIAYVLQKAR